jgi:hypothetical protein
MLPKTGDAARRSRLTPTGRLEKRTLRHSLDHLVGAADECVGDGDPERLGTAEVYDEFDFCCLLDGQIGWLVAFEDAAGIDAS